MSTRYSQIVVKTNTEEIYEDLLLRKNLKSLVQYETFNFNQLQNISDLGLTAITHRVQPFEKLFMISQKYYDSPEYGWLICYTNKLANETKIKAGDVLTIYLPLSGLLRLL
jgi:hypothetical protein